MRQSAAADSRRLASLREAATLDPADGRHSLGPAAGPAHPCASLCAAQGSPDTAAVPRAGLRAGYRPHNEETSDQRRGLARRNGGRDPHGRLRFQPLQVASLRKARDWPPCDTAVRARRHVTIISLGRRLTGWFRRVNRSRCGDHQGVGPPSRPASRLSLRIEAPLAYSLLRPGRGRSASTARVELEQVGLILRFVKPEQHQGNPPISRRTTRPVSSLSKAKDA